jgi:ribose transport system substrate-binding protein
MVVFAACGDDDDSSSEGSSGTSSEAADSDKPVKIAYFEFSFANTFTQASVEGAKEEAKKQGNVEIVEFDGEANPEKQASDMQDALATGDFDGWMIYQVGPASLALSQQAIAKGVKVVGMLVPFGPDPTKPAPQLEGQLAGTYADHGQLGRDLGKLTVEACADADPCKVEYLHGYKALPLSAAIKDAFDETIAENPAIKVVAEQDGQYLADPSYTVTQNVLQANPDLNVVVTGGSQMTLGAERAVKAAGKTKQVKLIGSYGSKLGVDAVCEGRWFGETVSLPKTEGMIAVRDIVHAVRGKPLPFGVAPDLIKEFSPVGRVITKENCAEFEPEWAG